MNKSEKSISIFNDKAAGYAAKFNNLEKYHDGFDLLISKLSNHASILDMACGPGNISNYLLSIQPNLKILGIDLAPKMLEIASANNKNADFKLCDIREIQSLKEDFNAIVLGFGMPYLSKNEAEQAIKDIYQCLGQNGVLYISTMEGKYSNSSYQKSSDGSSEMFIYYHEAEYIQQFLESTGFKIIWEKHQPYFEGETLRFTDYIIVAQKMN